MLVFNQVPLLHQDLFDIRVNRVVSRDDVASHFFVCVLAKVLFGAQRNWLWSRCWLQDVRIASVRSLVWKSYMCFSRLTLTELVLSRRNTCFSFKKTLLCVGRVAGREVHVLKFFGQLEMSSNKNMDIFLNTFNAKRVCMPDFSGFQLT